MRTILRLSLIVGFVFSAKSSLAYEIETHDRLSEAAHNASFIVTDPNLLSDLGIKSSDKFPNSKNDPNLKSVVELIRDGARFEDGFKCSDPRPRNHFYDPTHSGQGLQWGLITGKPSPDWALEDINSIGDQDFSFQDGRGYFYKALTEPKKTDRDKNFGLTFQTIGHVIHHIEDMAQPQHVRNDPHYVAPEDCGVVSYLGKILGDNHSRYELYTNENRGSFPSLPSYASVYGDGDSTTFNTPRKLWATGTGAGIAEFTNRNFVSAGTNFELILKDGLLLPTPNSRYVSPVPEPTLEPNADIKGLLPGTALTGTLSFYGSKVYDQYNRQTYFNGRAASLSIFDQDLQNYNASVTYTDFNTGETRITNKLFTLNRFNFDEAHKLLIPRAVGYSAGLINYFFRGKIDFVKDPGDSTKYIIKNLSKEAMTGTFTLYYDDKDDNRHPVLGAKWENLTIVASKDSAPLTFTPPTTPAPKNADEYMLVFKGVLGQEDNAVVGRRVKSKVIVVVGQSGGQAFRWTKEGGMVGLGFLPGDSWSEATAVSADGKVVVGRSEDKVFRWTQATGMIGLGTFPGNFLDMAYTVSADGSVVVAGQGDESNDDRPFRWTQSGGMENLSGVPKYTTIKAHGVSPDGSVIVGQARWRDIPRFPAERLNTSVAEGVIHSAALVGTIDPPILNDVPFNYTRWQRIRTLENIISAAFLSFDAYPTPRQLADKINAVQNLDVGNLRTEINGWGDELLSAMQARLPVRQAAVDVALAVFNECIKNDTRYFACDNEYSLWWEASNRVGYLNSRIYEHPYLMAEDEKRLVRLVQIIAQYKTELNTFRDKEYQDPAEHGLTEEWQAFRWTAAGGIKGLGFLSDESESYANGVSANGAVVIGSDSNDQTFRWTTGGMVPLGALPGADWSEATAVSADGSVVVGYSGDPAFRWTQSNGMVGLSILPDSYWAGAYGVSADGSVIVGISGGQAVIWEKNEKGEFEIVPLGFIPGAYAWSEAKAVAVIGQQ